jgi:hypothetical protein
MVGFSLHRREPNMSWDPNSAKQGSPGYGQQPRYDPYAPPRRSSLTWLWALVGGGALLVLLCCGGGFLVMRFGFSVMAVEVKDQLRDNPKVREHLGEITQFDMDLTGSMAAEGEDVYRYKVRGTKGSGELTVKHHTGDNDKEVIDKASLRLSNGTTLQVVP